MSTPIKSQEELALDLINAVRDRQVDQIQGLLESGADPLRLINLKSRYYYSGEGWKEPNYTTPMEAALHRLFDHNCDYDSRLLESEVDSISKLLRALSQPLSRELLDIVKDKIPLPDSFYGGKEELKKDAKDYEPAYEPMQKAWKEVRSLASYSEICHELIDIAKKEDGLSKHLVDEKHLLEKLRFIANRQPRLYRYLLSDETLWKSPEDRYDVAKSVDRTIPPVGYRGLNKDAASTHLARYLRDNTTPTPSGRGGKA